MKLDLFPNRRPFRSPRKHTTPTQRAEADVRRKELGNEGEDLAVAHLLERGFTILDRNVHTDSGELDIVALAPHRARLVFVEVRTRKWRGSMPLVRPEWTVTLPKQRKIILQAKIWLARRGKAFRDLVATFDVIGVVLPAGEVTHIECAFEAE